MHTNNSPHKFGYTMLAIFILCIPFIVKCFESGSNIPSNIDFHNNSTDYANTRLKILGYVFQSHYSMLDPTINENKLTDSTGRDM